MPCHRPFNKNGVPCPCGKCEPCRKRHASGWSFRILKEAERLGSAFFITLTYDNEHCPMKYLKKIENRSERKTWKAPYFCNYKPRHKTPQPQKFQHTKLPTCDITHLQKFMKRLRKSNHSKEIKFYAVSEYGRESKRPHYHVIVMGMDIISFVGSENWKLYLQGKKNFEGKSMSNFNVSTWKNGHVNIGKVTGASVAYTLKYITKGRVITAGDWAKRQPEKSIMSKGIGQCYINKHTKKQHANNLERQYVTTDQGIKIPIPRYLKNQLYDEVEREYMVKVYAERYMNEVLEMNDDKKLKKLELKKRIQVDREKLTRLCKNDKL